MKWVNTEMSFLSVYLTIHTLNQSLSIQVLNDSLCRNQVDTVLGSIPLEDEDSASSSEVFYTPPPGTRPSQKMFFP